MPYSSNKTINGLEAETSIADTDELIFGDVSDTNRAKKITFANLKTEITGDDTSFVRKTDYDANSILYATSDNTPVALTVGTNSVVGRVGGNITTLAVDSDLSSVSASDDTVPSAKATKTALDLKADDSAVVKLTGDQTVAGVKTFTSDPLIPDEAYGSGWNGVLEPPTKNAVYDKIETMGSITDAFANTPNTSETNATWYTWTQPFIATAVPVMLGFTNTFTVSTNDYGGFGHKTLSASASVVLYDKLSGNGSNETYTAASSKDIKFKWRMRQGVSGAGDYLGFGIANASTTFDDIQTSTVAGVRFVNNNGVIYASNGDGSANTNTNVDSGITDANWNVYEIVFNPGTDAKFYINGTLVATHTTNLPTGSLELFGIGYTKGTNNITIYINPVTISLEL